MTPSSQTNSFEGDFQRFFQTPVALAAGKPLATGAQIRLKIRTASPANPQDFVFRRTRAGQDLIPTPLVPAAELAPQLTFELSPEHVQKILDHAAQPEADIGSFGVLIVREMFRNEPSGPEARIQFQLHAGFLTLFRFGYFGVITAGGPSFASELASRGFSGMNAIKAALQKLRASP